MDLEKRDVVDSHHHSHQPHGHHHPGEHHHSVAFTFHLNNKPVKIAGHHHTGLEIKTVAIAQGVKIQTDFVLSEELSHGRNRIIGDDECVEVNAHTRFDAIPNDDHS